MNLPQLIQTLRELEAKATKGPWKSCDVGPWGGQGAGLCIGDDVKDWVTFGKRTEEPHISNSFLCMEARNALPTLLSALEEARYVALFYADHANDFHPGLADKANDWLSKWTKGE